MSLIIFPRAFMLVPFCLVFLLLSAAATTPLAATAEKIGITTNVTPSEMAKELGVPQKAVADAEVRSPVADISPQRPPTNNFASALNTFAQTEVHSAAASPIPISDVQRSSTQHASALNNNFSLTELQSPAASAVPISDAQRSSTQHASALNNFSLTEVRSPMASAVSISDARSRTGTDAAAIERNTAVAGAHHGYPLPHLPPSTEIALKKEAKEAKVPATNVSAMTTNTTTAAISPQAYEAAKQFAAAQIISPLSGPQREHPHLPSSAELGLHMKAPATHTAAVTTNTAATDGTGGSFAVGANKSAKAVADAVMRSPIAEIFPQRPPVPHASALNTFAQTGGHAPMASAVPISDTRGPSTQHTSALNNFSLTEHSPAASAVPISDAQRPSTQHASALNNFSLTEVRSPVAFAAAGTPFTAPTMPIHTAAVEKKTADSAVANRINSKKEVNTQHNVRIPMSPPSPVARDFDDGLDGLYGDNADWDDYDAAALDYHGGGMNPYNHNSGEDPQDVNINSGGYSVHDQHNYNENNWGYEGNSRNM